MFMKCVCESDSGNREGHKDLEQCADIRCVSMRHYRCAQLVFVFDPSTTDHYAAPSNIHFV